MKFDRKVSEYVEFTAPRSDFPVTIKCSATSIQSPYAGEPLVFFSIEFPNAAVWYRKNVHVPPTMRAKRIFSVDLSIGVRSCSLDLILFWFSFFANNIVASGSALLKE